ncbi:MAG TPA: nucleotide exchange factor GrpE [Candidatus Scalindua sp.]|nr:nucleotide exchange factor GrpE [Candidatus Scalindua sp.]
MSKKQNNQDEENVNTEQGDSMNGEKDQENLENSQENSESGAGTEVNESNEEAVQEETQDDLDALDDLTKEEILEFKKKAAERDTYLDQLLRTKAEFMNYQKRMVKESESTSQFAVQNLILDFLPELDNFDRALKLADTSKDIDKFVEGIKLIEEQLFKVLGKYGVESIETVGKAFDPNLHEAVMEEENNEMPHHTIIDEFQRGFLLKKRVIRPSKVKVSRRTVEEEDASDE